MVLASAIAARTTTLRVALAAVITPLRHPLQLAKQLGTLDLLAKGWLVVQPTVSWSEEEYVALGVPFHERGAILDEQLVAMRAAWTQSPAFHDGPRFPFGPVWCEPHPHREGGPTMWPTSTRRSNRWRRCGLRVTRRCASNRPTSPMIRPTWATSAAEWWLH